VEGSREPGGDLDAIAATNVWNVPPSAVPDGQGAFVLSTEGPSADRTRWFFVLPGVARDRPDRTYLVVDERGLRIVKGPVKEAGAKKVLGAIIGTMDSAFDAF
jgi:hypothetical protein